MSGPVTLRAATPGDEAFLRVVYTSTREEEMAAVPWDAAQKAAFLRFQFDAQDRHYRLQFPRASYQVICAAGRPVGRLYVDRNADEIRILDIALLPAFRGCGIGSGLLRDLMADAVATGRPLRLHVEGSNTAALRLYARLGFRRLAETGAHRLMEWSPE